MSTMTSQRRVSLEETSSAMTITVFRVSSLEMVEIRAREEQPAGVTSSGMICITSSLDSCLKLFVNDLVTTKNI